MSVRMQRLWAGLAVALFALCAGAFGAPRLGLAQAGASVGVAQNASFGAILTTADGKTLYTFSADSGGKSACTGQCATAWPPATISSTTPTAPSGVTASALTTITRDDGSYQLAYNGKPLYTFSRDTAAGQVNGNGVNAFNGTWSVAKVNGAASAAGTPSAASGGAASGSGGASALPATGSGGLGSGADSLNTFGIVLALACVVLLSTGFAVVRLSRGGRR